MRTPTNLVYILRTKKRAAFNGILIAIFIYFVFHAIVGNRGLIAYFQLSNTMAESASTLDKLKAERLELEHKVNLLKSSIDLDMLDQEARRVLGIAHPNEKVFVAKQKREEKK